MPHRWLGKNLMAEIEWKIAALDKFKAQARVKGISKRQAFLLGLAAIVLTALVVSGIAAMLIFR